MKNMKIGTRLGLGFCLVLLLMLTLIVVGLTRFASIDTSTSTMIEEDWVKSEAAHVINVTTRDQVRRNMELLQTADKAQREKIYQRIEANKKVIVEALQTLDRLIYLPEGKTLLEKLKTERAQYVVSFSKVGVEIESGRIEEAKRIMLEETLPRLDKLEATVTELAGRQTMLAEKSAKNVKADLDSGSKLFIALGIGALLIAVACAYLISRSITRPINRAVDLAKTVASGDLTSVVEVDSTDETGQLLQSLKDMNTSLLAVVTDVRGGTETVSTASSQIAAGNLDLSSRTEEQASALEETAASMEQLTSTVKQNADNALQANQLASSASTVALKGGTVVAEVVQTMNAINESAHKIADIISVIDSIAFQTNILALNAAVEAARAGEQGRGFAVVATEVRALAQRSAAAAKEIKSLIGDSVANVDAGCRLVEQAGSTMDEIVVSVRRVTDIMAEIAAASNEQKAGIEQINQAINQMDQVTQQNAALVEESAAAAASLEKNARELNAAVSVFKVNDPGSQFAPEKRCAESDAPPARVTALKTVRRKADSSLSSSARTGQAAPYKKVANARPGSPDEWEEY